MSRKPIETANIGAGLWKGTGMWAWLLFRISGLILVLYMFAHIIVISTGQWGSFNRVMQYMDKTIFTLFELALIVAVFYHALNGIRIVLMDLGIGVHKHKLMFWSAMFVVVVCFAVFAWVTFTYIITGKGVTG